MDPYLHLHHLNFIGGHLFKMFNPPLQQLSSPIILMIVNFIPLVLTMSTSLAVTPSSRVSFRVDIARINSKLKLPNSQTAQSTIKLEGFSSQAANPTPSPSFKSSVLQADGEFIMNMSLGTPPRQFPAIMDTGSDLVWTQCMPCMACYHQATPVFDPNASSSFSPLPCSSPLCASKTKKCMSNLCRYKTLYGDMSFTQGYLATDTFILGDSTHNVSIPNIGFGCGNNNGGSGLDTVAGIIGLGRGPLSLVTQLKVKKFSYCLPVLGENKKGTLSFGSLADEGFNASSSQGTPILENPVLPSRYYVSLEGISVDDTLLR
ncbi:aspartic proteinase nepenthesin-1-like [Chenopodium quinoa]|uniref:aspartic proteinase nepenthesin-1-like n=1 Tax=Chenopodium quinoa TaxID=63459 RepID=UPI000B76E36A|nr:aspartic proteinase nepenthesin-1-like [Chenopodium quinoa]